MKRLAVFCFLAALSLGSIAPADAARRVVVGRGRHHRTVVVVHRGWPLRRPLRAVVVHPPRVVVRVRPAVFMPVVVWTSVVVAARPTTDVLIWEDGETLSQDEDWSEVTLDCDARGTKVWLEIISGKLQFDWAEVVFDNGDTRVVDMKARTRGAGIYPLLDFKDGREVDHVRLVARARTYQARVVLRMEK